MADEHTQGQPTNGANRPAPARPSREQLLADMSRGIKPDLSLKGEEAAAAPAAAAASAPSVLDQHPEHGRPVDDLDAEVDAEVEAPAAEAETAAAGGDGEDADVDVDDDVEAELDVDDDDDKKPDPKRIAAVRRYEQRVRAEISTEKAAMQREREQMRADAAELRAKVDRFERAVARVKYDPGGLLAELGYGDDDWEPASKMIYARSKKAAADPNWKNEADRVSRDRQHSEEMAKLQRRIDEMETREKTTREQADTQRAVDGFLDDVTRVVDDTAPLMKKMLAKVPKKARLRLYEAASQVAERLPAGEAPSVKAVIKRAELARRAELEELDIDVSAYVKAPTKTTTAAAGSGTGKNAKPAAAGGAKPEPKKGSAEWRASLLRDLDGGNLS